jgi:hypothetical protein
VNASIWSFPGETSFSTSAAIPIPGQYRDVFPWLDRVRKCGCSHGNGADILLHSSDTAPGEIFPGKASFSTAAAISIPGLHRDMFSIDIDSNLNNFCSNMMKITPLKCLQKNKTLDDVQ